MSKLQKALKEVLPHDWLETDHGITQVRALATTSVLHYDIPQARMRNLSTWSAERHYRLLKVYDVLQGNRAVDKLIKDGRSPTMKQALMVLTRTNSLRSVLPQLDIADEQVKAVLMSVLSTLTYAYHFLGNQVELSNYAVQAINRAVSVKSALLSRLLLTPGSPLVVRDNVHYHAALGDPSSKTPHVFVFTLFQFAMVAVSLADEDPSESGCAWYLFQDTRTASYYLHIAGYKVFQDPAPHRWSLSPEYSFFGISAASEFTPMVNLIVKKLRADGYDPQPSE